HHTDDWVGKVKYQGLLDSEQVVQAKERKRRVADQRGETTRDERLKINERCCCEKHFY
ncbi:hypothetical protein AVEN_1892-1, partial [Araneus ventricosus]